MSRRTGSRASSRANLLLAIGLLLAGLLGAAWPATLAAQESEALPSVETLEGRLETWRAEVPEPTDGTVEALDLLEQQLESALRGQELAQEIEAANRGLEQGPAQSLEAPPPYGFPVLDAALDKRAAEELAERVAQESIESLLGELEDAERSRREAVESLWSTRAAEARVELARQRLANARREQEVARSRFDLAQQVVIYVDRHLQATRQEYEAELARLADLKLQVEVRLQSIERDAALAERRWHDAQRRAEQSPSPASHAKAAARRATLDLEDAKRRGLSEQLERLQIEEEIWRHRFQAAIEDELYPPPDQDLAEIEGLLELQSREQRVQLSEYRAERQGVATRIVSPEIDEETTRWIELRQQTLLEGMDLFEGQIADTERLLALLERVQKEAAPHSLRFEEWLGSVWRSMDRAWRLELMVVDDRPVTLGKALLAFLLVVIGYRVSKRVSLIFGNVLRRRFHVSSGASAALQNLVLYLLLVIFFLWAFQLVGIPLTVFTVLGGVVAIGVGFGSQNIVNNFISGLILLIERPIKVGDLIEVDGVVGSVERIGLRSTKVRAGDNTHVIVPNSSFLEKPVLNWTVSDDVIRAEVDVGVAYGSPTADVKRLIEKALDEEPLVLSSRGWDVLFIEFGDNALLFRAYFWIRVDGYLDRLRAASAVRFRIDQLFGEAEIAISFPQRDVHLDTVSPLEVRLMEGSSSKPQSAGD